MSWRDRKGGLTAGVWMYLPVFVQGMTAQQYGKEYGNPGNSYYSESDVDASLEAEAVLGSHVSNALTVLCWP
jgi:hypothetical protein